MSLHGIIQINDYPIGRWQARRTTPVALTGEVAVYECKVELLADQDVHGKKWPHREWEGNVEHPVGAGALALMQELLRVAEEDFKKRGLY